MAATLSGAAKAFIEGMGLSLSVYRDRAPKDEPLPFVVVQEGISIDTIQMGDYSDTDAERVVAELIQVTLFQEWRKADGKAGESYTLAADLHRKLHGSQFGGHAPKNVQGVTVQNHVRLPSVDGPGSTTDAADGANVVQDVLTLRVRRNL